MKTLMMLASAATLSASSPYTDDTPITQAEARERVVACQILLTEELSDDQVQVFIDYYDLNSKRKSRDFFLACATFIEGVKIGTNDRSLKV